MHWCGHGEVFRCCLVVVFTFGGELADSLWLVSSLREEKEEKGERGGYEHENRDNEGGRSYVTQIVRERQ